MNYSDDLDIVVNSALEELIRDYMNGSKIFNGEKNKMYLEKYLNIKQQSRKN
jgi:hypothetical protein